MRDGGVALPDLFGDDAEALAAVRELMVGGRMAAALGPRTGW